MILILNVWVEASIGGDQSADHNGSAEGRCSAHLNMDQSDGFEHPSHRGFFFFERGGLTPIVCYTDVLCRELVSSPLSYLKLTLCRKHETLLRRTAAVLL